MTKEQVRKEAVSIMRDFSEKCDLIEKEAKRDGIWQMGLDSNRGLLKTFEKEAKEKLKCLAAKIEVE